MSEMNTLFSSTAVAVAGTAVVIAVHDPVADIIGGTVALGALVVATRSGILLAGEGGGPGDAPSPADLALRRREGAPRP